MKGVPQPAMLLGLTGALPFAGLAILAIFGVGFAGFALQAYGVAILSFMGGIHWGLAMAQNAPNFQRLGLSVIPALIGWLAILIGGGLGFIMLAAAFAGLLVFDLRCVERGQAPEWYPVLRKPLTAIVILSLLAGAFGG